ncbi:hypothetical protein FNV43_RR14948 [Rhamnella rubrinervis]|uniref:HMA domain-containing protein n=1 Tax=Rhamnella rubrinervis TaxID=2594499 RepID=A0A8K0H420_9ROSA|nr:hypothetical protein FNV43_RR14948 [Rhamnella rubrinervis]
MTTPQDSELLEIETYILKVNINCQGCAQKVRKLLRNIEGVYNVNIDAEKQQVMVIGSVDSATLIKKLLRYGKHAELCSPTTNQLEAKMNTALLTGLNASRNQHPLPAFFGTEGDHGLGSMAGEFRQNFITTNEENTNLGSDANTKIVNVDKFQENIMNMTAGTGGEAGFTGFGRHGEFGDLQSYTAEPLVWKYDNLPPTMKTYMMMNENNYMEEDRSSYYNMVMNENQIYRNQPLMNYASPMIPFNNDSYFKFESASTPGYYY